jgi:[ribosomal protein S18]-alanine N-acetyltransferase
MTDAKITIRPMARSDVDRVMAIATSLAQAPRWGREAYESALTLDDRRIAWVAEISGMVAGFAVASLVIPEAELETMGIAAEWQGKGVGRQLLEALLRSVWERDVTKVMLEVRDSNAAAQGLYRSHGFEESGRRRGYYIDSKEDAVLMQLLLTPR